MIWMPMTIWRGLLMMSLLLASVSSANQLFVYSTPGTYLYVVPAGVTSITVETWGAGGRGGSTTANAAIRAGGGGGGGGYARATIAVSPGQTYTLIVGAGSTTASTAGGTSLVRRGSTDLVSASGGSSPANNTTTGGTGGAGTVSSPSGYSITDAVTRTGGAGAGGSTTSGSFRGGGGGGSAGPNNNGNAGSAAAAGAAVTDGGAGGAASTGAGNGTVGGDPGGGGGGGANCGNCGTRSGGDGGDGLIRVSYLLAEPTNCFTDDFERASLGTDWVTNVTGGSFQPQIITVGSNDRRLRMTQAVGNQATAASLQRLLPAADNYVVVEFDYYAYGGNGADGVTIVLSDATITPRAGSFGGSLGYAQRDDGTSGFAGGWLGMGLDEYGNFPVANEGKLGGVSARVLQNVSIRGSGSGTTGYRYLAHSNTLSPAVDGTGSGTAHRYRIEVDSTVLGKAVVRVKRNSGSGMQTIIGPHDILALPGQAAVPENFMLSITGSTGGSNNIHEFGNFRLCARQLQLVGQQIDHFEISHPGAGVTCQSTAVTVRACLNAACTLLYTDPVTVTLSPSGWVGGDTRTFTGGTTTVNFLRTTASTPTLGFTTSTPTTRPFTQTLCRNNGSTAQASQCGLTVRETGFLVTVPDILASQQTTAAQIRSVRKDDNSQACVPAFENVTRSVRFWTDYLDPGPNGRPESRQALVNGQAIGNTSGTSTPLNIAFGNGGVANLTLNYTDAGQMNLNARYDGSLATSDVGLLMTGSDPFVSRPVGLCVQTGGECASANASCPVFVKAGQSFPLIVRAVGWQSNSDTDLCTGNTSTPNFALDNIPLSAVLMAPSGGNGGSLSPLTYNHVAAANGQNDVNVTESEVGVFQFRAGPSPPGTLSYLGGTMGGGLSASTGRFYPDRFALSSPVSGKLAPHCSVGTRFFYSGQTVGWEQPPEVIIEALAVNGGRTRNYTMGGFQRLVASSVVRASPSTDTTALNTAGNLMPVSITTPGGALEVLDPGRLTYRYSATDQIRYEKSLTARVAPFLPKLSFRVTSVTDGDGVTAPSVPLIFSPEDNGEVRYGHLVLDNVYGPENIATLPMPFRLEYWQGTRFVLNREDSCWNWNSVDVTKTGNRSTLTAANGFASQGTGGNLSLTPTGSTGTDELQWTVPPWLQDYWQSSAALSNPKGLATFGVFRGHDRVIYWREVPQ